LIQELLIKTFDNLAPEQNLVYEIARNVNFATDRMDLIFKNLSHGKSIFQRIQEASGFNYAGPALGLIRNYVIEISDKDLIEIRNRLETQEERFIWFQICRIDDEFGGHDRSNFINPEDCKSYQSRKVARIAQAGRIARIPDEWPVEIIPNGSFNRIGEKFNSFVSEYFRSNFGDAGVEYLRSLRGIDHDILTSPCTENFGYAAGIRELRTGSLLAALEGEIRHVIKAFEGGFISKKKQVDQIRYRVHEVVGFIQDVVQSEGTKCILNIGDSRSTHEVDQALTLLKASYKSNPNLKRYVISALRVIGTLAPNGYRYFYGPSLESVKGVIQMSFDTSSSGAVLQQCNPPAGVQASSCRLDSSVRPNCWNNNTRDASACNGELSSFVSTCNPNMFCQAHVTRALPKCSLRTMMGCNSELSEVQKWCSADTGAVNMLFCDARNKLIEKGDIGRFNFFETNVVPVLRDAYACWYTKRTTHNESILKGFENVAYLIVNSFNYEKTEFWKFFKGLKEAACSSQAFSLLTPS
jgi:hypothetical protein